MKFFTLKLSSLRTLWLLIGILGPSHSTLGNIIQYEVHGSFKKKYSLKEVCSNSGVNNPVLVEANGMSSIDCMGWRVIATDFCLKQQHPYLLRGYVEKNEVICQEGKRLFLSYECQPGEESYCGKTAEKGCLELKTTLANKLSLFRSSDVVHEKTKKKILRCYFLSTDEEEKQFDEENKY